MEIIINSKVFKQFRNTIYYVSKDGEIYSTYSKKIIKQLTRIWGGKTYAYIDVYDTERKKQQHITVHRIVYTAWVRELNEGEQINHHNDNSMDNRLENLYIGTQQENIADCVRNEHRVGNVFYITLEDKESNQILTFCPASKFIEYCGHPSKNGSISKFFNKNWFNKRYRIIEFKRINKLSEYRSVTTMADECKPVE